MTPGDEAFENAFRRADVGRLAGLVDPAGCPPGVLERLLRHEDPRVRSLGLVSLGERVAVVGGRADACEQLAAALLPMAMSAAGHAAWSTQDTLVLAELYARLGPHAPKPYALADRVPSRRTAGLPVRVRIAWLRAEIANDPTHLRREPASEALYQAVRDTDIAAACRPRQLVAELLESGDQVLAGQSLRLAREGLHAGIFAVALVRAHLVRLLDLGAEHALGSATVVAALTELSESWATLEPLPPHRVSGLLTAAEATVRPEVAEAALTALARHGHSDDRRQIVGDPDLPPRLRRRALELLGALATRDDIRELTALAARDPLLFGEPAVTCLRGLHRRGHFVTAPDVPAVVALALADHAIAPCEIATILFTCRQEMFRLLTDATADDPSWPRRLALLVALAGQGTGDAGEPGELPVGDVITCTLKATSAPRPFLEALRALRHTAAEEAVLARLAAEPATVLRTLEAIGGRRTVSALRDGLGLAALESGGWRPAIALRIARRGELPPRHRPHSLRPTLADWLTLADRTRDPAQTPTGDPAPDSLSDTRTRLVRTALRLCPPPLSEAERRTYARFTPLLRMCLAEAATWEDDGQDLVTVLEELAPTLPTVEKRAVADAVRALPGTAPAPTLTLLRRCGAVLTRADLDQALEAAATGWSTAARAERVAPAEVAVLREAFGITDVSLPSDTRAWRVQLAAAVRGPSEAAKFRRAEESRQGASRPNSRHALAALADTYCAADPVTRSVLLDWMTALQPLDAPPWTLGEAAADDAASAAAPSRTVRAGDLDQPRSAALRARLLDMLDAPDPDRRRTAATALLKWPDPDVRSAVLRAYLHGRVDLGVHIPADVEPPGLLAALADTGGAEIRYERLARLAVRLDPSVLQPLVPRLLERWQQAPQAVRPVLDAVPAGTLAVILGDRMEAGAWGFLDLLAGRTLLRTPALTEIRRRLRAEGREALAESLRLVDGPLRDPGAERDDAHERARSTAPPRAPDGPSRQESLRLARTGSPDQIRRALNRLAEEHPGPHTPPPQAPTSREAPDDPELRALIGELLHHPRPRVRLHAHRTSRSLFDRETYLRHTSTLLGDAQPDVVRSAVRTLTHAAWEPAVPAVVALLGHPHPAVRAAAVDGLAHLGGRAVPALRHAADHARPDKRSAYAAVLDRITATQTDQTRDSAGKPVQRSSAGR
ncbi:hypothetical protein SSPS47_34295 [Streptomyces sp. S4.7]|uniref:HEAT repeat domain-containing protein n=1 Tax=Streptomyces sp. S4.7 TaxID=2705439 RepID=UPI0013983E02|nr:HEAT repeat domain-containing protein [Streptomyces sp. S4.7]QHZ00171.1 hypothetical protein SSPS47_34295 [Streptomyces sp. S4.7]